MFIPDTPITNEQEDELNRRDFAKKLADTIRDWDRKESIVIGLFGPWGSGKTSILNVAIHHIKQTTQNWEKAKRPILIRFNPWIFSEQDILLRAFLQQVFSAVNDRLPIHKKDFGKQINALAQTLGAFEKVPVAGPFLALTGKTIDLINPQATLQILREKIDEYFRQLNCRVIIVLDDIDRLTQSEIRHLFQIIKINADFPNTIYLIAFDRGVVEAALTTNGVIKGRDYLEKIVQVGFDVPLIEKVQVEKILFTEIDKILSSNHVKRWDPTHWGYLYHSGLNSLFVSLRDVKRFINGLAFNFNMVSEEVNPVDFIGIEALRLFIPEVYRGIAGNKVLFTQRVGGERINPTELKDKYEEIFATTDEKYRNAAREICIQLFPAMRVAYPKQFIGSDYQSNWRQERRICSEDVFDVFFLLGTPQGDVSQIELDSIALNARDAGHLLDTFKNINQEGRIVRLLDLLRDILDKLDTEGARGLSQALLQLGDELPKQKMGFLHLADTDFQIASVIDNALQKLEPNERCEWLLGNLRSGTALFMPVYLVWRDMPGEEQIRKYPLFQDECLELLSQECVNQLRFRAQNETLSSVKGLSILLFRWRDWSKDDKDLQCFIDNMLKTPLSALNLLLEFLNSSEVYTYGDQVSRPEWNVDLLKEFVDFQKLNESLSSLSLIDAEAISERHKLALETFRDAVSKQAQHN